MIDWDHKDTVADLREKISTLRNMLMDAHRREDALLKQNNRLTEYAARDTD